MGSLVGTVIGGRVHSLENGFAQKTDCEHRDKKPPQPGPMQLQLRPETARGHATMPRPYPLFPRFAPASPACSCSCFALRILLSSIGPIGFRTDLPGILYSLYSWLLRTLYGPARLPWTCGLPLQGRGLQAMQLSHSTQLHPTSPARFPQGQ